MKYRISIKIFSICLATVLGNAYSSDAAAAPDKEDNDRKLRSLAQIPDEPLCEILKATSNKFDFSESS